MTEYVLFGLDVYIKPTLVRFFNFARSITENIILPMIVYGICELSEPDFSDNELVKLINRMTKANTLGLIKNILNYRSYMIICNNNREQLFENSLINCNNPEIWKLFAGKKNPG